MFLETIPRRTNRKLPSKRIGRGYGSGVGGHTVGRGTKGQKSRSGHKSTIFFEGGNVPFFRRIPKYKGFKRNNKIEYQPVNLDVLNSSFNDGEVVSVEELKNKKLIRKRTAHVKVLGYGDLTKKLKIQGLLLSKTANEKILAVGGSIE